MITKRKPHVLQLVLALALAAHATADILRFGDGALPSCAYDCQPLYAAQYECADGDAACFCARVGEEICADVCAGESRRVAAWVAGECAATSPTPAPATSSAYTTPISTTKASKTTTATAPPKPSSSSDAEEKKADPVEEGEKKDAAVKDPTVAHATAWWKKHWPYFLMALLLIAIPLLLLAFFVPFRKYVRRQIIRNRVRSSGITVPPVYLPTQQQDMVEYNSSQRVVPGSPGLDAQAVGVALSPGLQTPGLVSPGTISTMDLGVGGTVGSTGRRSMMDLGVGGTVGSAGGRSMRSGYLGNTRTASEFFGSDVGLRVGGTVRQESWERRLRERQKKKRGWLGRWFKGPEEETPALGHGSGIV